MLKHRMLQSKAGQKKDLEINKTNNKTKSLAFLSYCSYITYKLIMGCTYIFPTGFWMLVLEKKPYWIVIQNYVDFCLTIMVV